jgi:hypothetical protein
MHLTGSSSNHPRPHGVSHRPSGPIAEPPSAGDLQILAHLMQFPRVDVGLGGAGVGVAKPEGDHGGVDAGVQQFHGGCVPQDVRGEFLVRQGRAVLCGESFVDGDAPGDGVIAEASSGAGGEQWLVRVAASFLDPGAQHGGSRGGQGDTALFAAFAGAAHVGPGAELQVAAVEPDEFGQAKACLRGQGEVCLS